MQVQPADAVFLKSISAPEKSFTKSSVPESLNCFSIWIPTKYLKEKVRNGYPLIFAACFSAVRFEIEKIKIKEITVRQLAARDVVLWISVK